MFSKKIIDLENKSFQKLEFTKAINFIFDWSGANKQSDRRKPN